MRCLALITALSCFGCGPSLDFTATRKPPRALSPRSADQVELFMNAAPTRPYVEVGVIESQQSPGDKSQSSDMIAQMRALAAEHGCDGLANFTKNDSVTETMLAPGGASRTETLSGYSAACIVYSGPDPSASSAPSAPSAAATPTPKAACVPNATQLCYGPGGCRGGQSCTADGRGWTPCDCGNQSSPPAAADSGLTSSVE